VWPWGRRRRDDDDAASLGQQGEKLAAKFLRKQGLKILARNYRCPAGEADIIALDTRRDQAPAVVFVEVKTRASDRNTSPESAVNAAKQKHLRAVANYYRSGRDTTGLTIRFDVVAIILAPAQEPRIKHIVGAF
jgi:putative endonuclease